jgi:hypothetical protein
MAALAGYGGKITIATNVILTVKDWELPLTSGMYDVTTIQNIRGKSFVPGLYEAVVPLKMVWDASDTNGTIALQSNILATSPSVLAIILSTNNGTNSYTFNAWVKDLKVHDPVGGEVECDVSLQVNGAVSYA